MNFIKKAIVAGGVMSLGLMSVHAQSMENMLKIGVNAGFAVPKENASAAIGVDLSYQHLVTPSFGLGLATAYEHYFGSDNDGIKNNDFGVVPIAALVRFYPKRSGLYLGADLGYGFIVGDQKVASNSNVDRPDGGFYLKPEFGYHNRDWNFFLEYRKTFTGDKGKIGNQNYSAGSLGVGVAYNIPLGL